MSLSVDWQFASTVASRFNGTDPYWDAASEAVIAEMIQLTSQAEQLVAEETGLISAAGTARGRAINRDEWVDVNVKSFGRLLQPLLDRMNAVNDVKPSTNQPADSGSLKARLASVSAGFGPKAAGAEVGAILGWMSTKVLGQYDLLVDEDDDLEAQDWVYYVGPNMMRMERRYGFPPTEFRLWIAAHECTHRAQFTGVPWMRAHFLSLVNELLDSVDVDPARMFDVIKSVAAERQNGIERVKEGGLAALFASPEQKATMDKMTGLMSLLEGHGDVIMSRATEGLIPSQPRFARIMTSRRSNASFVARFVQRLTGIEGKMAQYREGAEFIQQVEAVGGGDLFNQVWTEPAALPTISEIRSPETWIARMGVATST